MGNEIEVSVLVPTRNEEDCITACLDSVLANDYPREKLEVLVLDGMSTDRTRKIVSEYAEQFPFIRLLDNPGRIVPTGLNRGIREARGEIIVRLDAHTIYASDYIRQCVGLLRTGGAANVGGVQRAAGTTYLTRAIALATTTPFGIGNAEYRYCEQPRWVDTVYLGAWFKTALESIGGFNEEWVVNEDYELNYRLRKAGGKVLLSPKILCWYHVRDSWRALARQYFRYGMWRVKTLVAHPESIRWRQLVAPAFVVSLAISALALAKSLAIGLIVPAVYASANLAVSVVLAVRHGWKYLALLPVLFALVHVTWGCGFLVGVARFGIPRLSVRGVRDSFCR